MIVPRHVLIQETISSTLVTQNISFFSEERAGPYQNGRSLFLAIKWELIVCFPAITRLSQRVPISNYKWKKKNVVHISFFFKSSFFGPNWTEIVWKLINRIWHPFVIEQYSSKSRVMNMLFISRCIPVAIQIHNQPNMHFGKKAWNYHTRRRNSLARRTRRYGKNALK